MRQVYAGLGAALMAVVLSVPGWAQTRTLPTQTVTISGTISY